MSLPGVDHVAYPKAEHIKTQYSHSSGLWAAPVNSKQPICDDQMTLALIKLHSIPATPILVGPTISWPGITAAPGLPLGCRPWALRNPGKLPGPFDGGSTLETINIAAADRGKTRPTQHPRLLCSFSPVIRPRREGRGRLQASIVCL